MFKISTQIELNLSKSNIDSTRTHFLHLDTTLENGNLHTNFFDKNYDF